MTFSFEDNPNINLIVTVEQGGKFLTRIETSPIPLQDQVINTLVEGIGDAIGLARSKEKKEKK
jgi:hypothetical protein